MSEKELNARIKANVAARKKTAVKRTVFVSLKLLAALLVFVGLNAIGFISLAFMAILALSAVCYGSFNLGKIWKE